MTARIWSAIPTPAVPAPKMTTRRSRGRDPATRIPLSAAARVTTLVPLHVAIEDPAPVAVLVQDPPCIRRPEILEVQQRIREQGGGYPHVLGDECVVALAAHSTVPVANVERVPEKRLAIGADVDHHRHDPVGVDAGGRRTHRELADRDRHPVGAPVSDAQDLLGVGADDQVDLVRVSRPYFRSPVRRVCSLGEERQTGLTAAGSHPEGPVDHFDVVGRRCSRVRGSHGFPEALCLRDNRARGAAVEIAAI